MEKRIVFNSCGDSCVGLLTVPDHTAQPMPLVILAGGWCYTKEIAMPHYARHFQSIGCATLLFDYRYFGESTGEPRQHIDPWRQIEDYRNALSFAHAQPYIDAKRTGIWGISLSGGHVLVLAATDPRPAFAISTIPMVEGFEIMRRGHGARGFAKILAVVDEDRRRRFAGEIGGYLPMSAEDPDRELCSIPFPSVYRVFNQIKTNEAPRHEHRNTVESLELLMQYDSRPFCSRILHVPVLMALAEGDTITPSDLEIDAFNRIANPDKTLISVSGVDHMSLYANPAHQERMGTLQAQWLRALLDRFRP